MEIIPEDLKLGVASAAYQVEGAWDAADKAPSIWDTFCRQPRAIRDGSSGDDACLSYRYYERDIQMVKFLGVDFYRFSISWPRLLPTGFSNKVSDDGAAYYNKLIDGLLANGIEPVVTMYHWDLPQSLQDLGGWTNPLVAEWFEEYARVLFTLYGDRVKTWVTINEPKQIGLFGYGMKRFAPGVDAHGIGEYLAAKHLLLAHARAYRLYHDSFRAHQQGVIGIAIATDFRTGATDSAEDVEAGRDAMDFEVGLYAHPIFSSEGGWPPSAQRRVAARSRDQGYRRSRLPPLTPDQVQFIRGTSDFYGFNHYSTKFYTRKDYKRGMYPEPSYEDDLGATWSYLHHEVAAVPHCTPIPEGMRWALNWVRETCNDPLIMVLENGYGEIGGAEGGSGGRGGLRDPSRVRYLQQYLSAALAARRDGCRLRRYAVWSLMDNFEWDGGLSVKFGLFETQYGDASKRRRARDSALWLRRVAAARAIRADGHPDGHADGHADIQCVEF